MRKWGIIQECVLCGEKNEMCNHLFFACPYSNTVWDKLASKLIGAGINPDWSDTLLMLQRRWFTAVDQVLIRLLFQTVVYHI